MKILKFEVNFITEKGIMNKNNDNWIECYIECDSENNMNLFRKEFLKFLKKDWFKIGNKKEIGFQSCYCGENANWDIVSIQCNSDKSLLKKYERMFNRVFSKTLQYFNTQNT